MCLEVAVCSGVKHILCNICVAVRSHRAISFPSTYVAPPYAYDSVVTRSFARPTLDDIMVIRLWSDRLTSFEKVIKALLTCRVLYAGPMPFFILVESVLRGEPPEMVYTHTL
jgi:hypothetical protein